MTVMAEAGLAVVAGDVVTGEVGDLAERQSVDQDERAGDSQVQRHAGVIQAGTQLTGLLAVVEEAWPRAGFSRPGRG